MFRQLLRFILCCLFTIVFTNECAQTTKSTVQKKTFNSCAPTKSTPIKLANNKPTQPTSSYAKAPADKPKTVTTSRSITVKNTISHDMLGYKKFGMHFYPDKEFRVFIDDKEIKENQTMKTTINNNVLSVNFKWDFGHKHRRSKGTRRIAFKIPPTANTVDLTFNWKTDSQVLIKNIDGVKFIPDLSDTRK